MNILKIYLDFEILNQLLLIIENLKSGKAAGFSGVSNEMLKNVNTSQIKKH